MLVEVDTCYESTDSWGNNYVYLYDDDYEKLLLKSILSKHFLTKILEKYPILNALKFRKSNLKLDKSIHYRN